MRGQLQLYSLIFLYIIYAWEQHTTGILLNKLNLPQPPANPSSLPSAQSLVPSQWLDRDVQPNPPNCLFSSTGWKEDRTIYYQQPGQSTTSFVQLYYHAPLHFCSDNSQSCIPYVHVYMSEPKCHLESIVLSRILVFYSP